MLVGEKIRLGFLASKCLAKKRIKATFDEVFAEIEKKGLFDILDSDQIITQYQNYRDGHHDDWAFIWRIYCLYKWKNYWLEELS